MRVVVATGALPFARGGAETLASQLCQAIDRAGHSAEKAVFFHKPFGSFLTTYLHARSAHLTSAHDGVPIDRLISLRFPAYAARHPFHVCWMLHRARPYYDLWGQFYASLPNHRTRWKERFRRRLIHWWDARCLAKVRRLFALSHEVRSRLAASGLESTVLYPPPRHGLDYAPAPPGQAALRTLDSQDYILSPSRLDDQKRIDLLLHALAAVPGARAVIAGEGPRRQALEGLAQSLGLGDRVQFSGFVSDARLTELYRHAHAVWFCPHREEFGYVTLEAMGFAKPLITASDSGGPTELVVHEKTALVIAPQPDQAAHAISRLLQEPTLAQHLGQSAHAARPDLSWPQVLAHLLEDQPPHQPL